MKLLHEIHEQLKFNKQLKRFTENSVNNDMQKHYSDDPDVQAAYENRFDAGLNDEGRHLNPHDKNNQKLHQAWLDGYEDGWEY